VHKAIGKLFKK